jgi:hypothetical protein
VVGGAITYAYRDAEKVLRHFRDFTLSPVPDPLTVFACLILLPANFLAGCTLWLALRHGGG